MQNTNKEQNTQTKIPAEICWRLCCIDKNTTFPEAIKRKAKKFAVEISPNRTSVNVNALCIVYCGVQSFVNYQTNNQHW